MFHSHLAEVVLVEALAVVVVLGGEEEEEETKATQGLLMPH